MIKTSKSVKIFKYKRWLFVLSNGKRSFNTVCVGIVCDRIDPFHQYDDLDSYARFWFCRAELLRITNLLDNDLQHNTNRNSALRPPMQVCLPLGLFKTYDSVHVLFSL